MAANVAGPGVPLEMWWHLDGIRQRVAAIQHPVLFCDFDGTLAPIVSVPALALLPADVKSILRTLNASDVVTVVASGRALNDLQDRVGLPLIFVGNHGLEIRGAGLEYIVPAAYEGRCKLLAICNRLRASLEPFAGALVEYKRLTASVHVRQVERWAIPAIVKELESTLTSNPEFQIRSGKEVFEIRPNTPWNKGSAVRWILEQTGGEDRDVICIGDDATDEDMFNELKGSITVRVGSDGLSSAQYRIGQAQVLPFLRFVCEALNESRSTRATHAR